MLAGNLSGSDRSLSTSSKTLTQKCPNFFHYWLHPRPAKNFSAAASAYRQAINLAPEHASFYYALGYCLGQVGDNAGATVAYRRTIELDRNNLNAYLGLGAVLYRQETTKVQDKRISRC